MQDDPLAQLRDVHLPDVPAFWPPAPGWWMLALLVLLLLAWIVYLLARRWYRDAPRRQALAELQRDFLACSRGELAPDDAIHRANALLKRLWVHVDGEREVAALSGASWLAYLDRRSGSQAFTAGAGRVLGSDRFSVTPPDFDAPLLALLQALLKSRATVAT